MAPASKKARTGEKEAGAKSQAKPSLAPTVACEDEVASKMKWAMSQLQTTLDALPPAVGVGGVPAYDVSTYNAAMKADKECELAGPITDFDVFSFAHASARPLMGDLALV